MFRCFQVTARPAPDREKEINNLVWEEFEIKISELKNIMQAA